jgi:colanic acid/amylovoran biosynthesis glycosyltransferase
LVGDGPLLAECQELVRELGLGAKVSFTGALKSDEIARELDHADAFLHHSVEAADGDKEGIPVSIMEAMAMGLPVVSTFHSGIPELIEHGISGFLVEERDIDGYAATLRQLIDSHQPVGEAANARVRDRFDLALSNAALLEIYRSLIEHGRLP